MADINVTLTIADGLTANVAVGTSTSIPVATAENNFLVGNSALSWVVKTLAQIKTILGLGSAAYVATSTFAAASHDHTADEVTPLAPVTVTFENPKNLYGAIDKDFIMIVEGDTTVNLTNTVDGDAGMIELIMDGSGGHTVSLGTMFTKNLGGGTIDTTASADNFISWRMIGTDIVYTISQIS